VPAALKAEAGKDAGPPAPHLDPAALAALKAEMSKSKGGKTAPAAKPASAPAAQAASTVGPASPSDSVPLPDRKPQ
jgi:hypothetical protein